uniref:LamG-like jellyroll fold domain-containing protein n=1 Tax=Mariniflexile sp. TaxID=1979402 RepID=UPI0040479DB9
MKKLLKKLTFVAILSVAFATVQAQTPVVHLKFENNLNNDGSSGLTFAVAGANNAGVNIPYSSGTITSLISGAGSVNGMAVGTYAINLTAVGDDGVDPAYALISNGAAYDAQIVSNANLGITGSAPRTIAAWVRYDDRNDQTNGGHTIVNIGDPNAGGGVNLRGKMQFLFEAANDQIRVAVAGGRIDCDYNPALIEDGNWHHVAFTSPNGATLADLEFYIDGSPVADNSGGANSALAVETVDDLIYVGTSGINTSKWFDGGGIDDLRIYDVSLTPAQILALYNGTLSTQDFAFGELKAYPNAVEDFLYLETASNNSLSISVFDITGKNIIRTSGKSVDMRSLTAGLYIVKVREDNKVANLKILKK